MSTTSDLPEHVLGRASPQRSPHARFETKAGHDSGAGYERWRSWEYRPHTPGDRKEDVYVPVHRLTAVVECYPEDMPIGDILADLHGKDVHHTTGVEWCNFGESPNFDEPGLEVLGHAEHSAITQAQIRAWAEDDKRRRDDPEPDGSVCGGCGDLAEPLAESADWDGVRCLPCAKQASDGAPIEVLQ